MRRLALLALFGLAGCITPSIPIPPPDPGKMDFHIDTTSNTAVLTYPPTDNYKGGVAYVYNRTQGVGVIQNVKADGSIGPTPPVSALAGNQMVFSIENGDQTVSQCIVLREGAQDPTSYCQ